MPTSPAWPPHLDALLAAPEHHRLLLENDSVRVLVTRINPGETVKLHTHQWPAAYYIISWSDFIRRDEHGNVTLDSRKSGLKIGPGNAVWSSSLDPHTLENIGSTPLHLISVEVKNIAG